MKDCNLKCNNRKCEEELFCQRHADYKQGRADAIDEFTQALHTQFEQNKALAKRCLSGNRVKELALTNIDLEEVDNTSEQLKEQKNEFTE